MRATVIPASTERANIPVASLIVRPDDNPRFKQAGRTPQECAMEHYASNEYRALCNSLDRLGMQVPLVVEKTGKQFRVLDGHGRAHWAATSSQKTVPAVVVSPPSQRDRLAVQVAVNVSRNTFAPLARAKAFKELLDAYDGDVKAAARVVGVAQSTFNETINLLLFPAPVQRAVGSKRIPFNCLDVLTSLPGWSAYRAVKRDERVGDHTVAEAEKYEDRLNQIITAFADDTDGAPINADDILAAWNAAKVADRVVTKPKRGKKAKVVAKGKAKPPTINEIVTLTPTEDSIRNVLEMYGTELAREYLSAEPSKSKIKRLTDLISNIAACMGWCVPENLHSVLLTTTNKPLYDADTAKTLTRDVVREYTLLGTIAVGMEKGLDLPENDPMREDDAAWEAYYRQDGVSLGCLVSALYKRLVSFRHKRSGA